LSALYVANTTNQIFRWFYRLDFSIGQSELQAKIRPPREQPIAPGRQERIPGDLHIGQIEELVSQLTDFGAASFDEIKRYAKDKVIPLIWSVDKPVSKAAIEHAFDHNKNVLREQGRKRREMAAIVSSESLAEKLVNEPRAFDVEFEEIDTGEVERTEPLLAEGFHVDRTNTPPH
jgi:hypothetical protein